MNEEWICPVEDIDSDIREVVKIAYENGMRPYMSCRGSFRDHEKKGAKPIAGCVELLDSEYIREIVAILIENPRYTCSIRKENAKMFYDNFLPAGISFQIEFGNVCGDAQTELLNVFSEVVNGRRALPQQRKNLDSICELVNGFDVRSGSKIAFTFNDPNFIVGRETDENYAIRIDGRKDVNDILNHVESTAKDIEQHDETCVIYGDNQLLMAAVLKKVVEDYGKAPFGKSIHTDNRSTSSTRGNRFLEEYNAGIDSARQALEESQDFDVVTVLPDDFYDLMNDDFEEL